MEKDLNMNLNKSSSQTPRRTLGLRRTSPRMASKTSPGISMLAERANESREGQQKTPITNHDNTPSMSQARETGYSINPTKGRKVLLNTILSASRPPNSNDNSGEINQEDIHGIIKELKVDNPELKDRLEIYEKYTNEKKELQRLISIWTNGGKEALKMIQKEVNPEQDAEQILTHLKLPTNIFDLDINKE